ncbi:MAG: transglutaminase-like domain-containing protein [Clostridia bacterium]|nr:transglutaminase-like domain-containing protein [Clostridia bacterium]
MHWSGRKFAALFWLWTILGSVVLIGMVRPLAWATAAPASTVTPSTIPETGSTFETYVGYGSLLTLTAPTSSENRAKACFSVSGWSQHPDVAAICAREDTGEARNIGLTVAPDGKFSGTIWLMDGPGRYSVSMAVRPPGRTSYIVVCSMCVVNTAESIPLVPAEYVGYGTDLTISSPRSESNSVVDELVVKGWSKYSRVRATVQNTATSELRTYFTIAGPDGLFELCIPLEAGFGPCEVKLASKQVDARTWRGVAVYRVIAERPPVSMIEPGYQRGSIFAVGRFKLRGLAGGYRDGSRREGPSPTGVRIEVRGREEKKGSGSAPVDHVIQTIEVPIVDGKWEAWINPPEGMKLFALAVGEAVKAADFQPTRFYTVVVVRPRAEPEPTEKWVIHSCYRTIQDLALSIASGADDPYDRAKAIHDWVARNIDYDVAGAKSGLPGPADAMSTLARRQSVCLGYSNLLAALTKASGIPAWVVTGMGDDGSSVVLHAWNEVLVNGRLVLMDATWDSGVSDGWSFVRRYTNAYFDPSPETFALGHFGDAR